MRGQKRTARSTYSLLSKILDFFSWQHSSYRDNMRSAYILFSANRTMSVNYCNRQKNAHYQKQHPQKQCNGSHNSVSCSHRSGNVSSIQFLNDSSRHFFRCSEFFNDLLITYIFRSVFQRFSDLLQLAFLNLLAAGQHIRDLPLKLPEPLLHSVFPPFLRSRPPPGKWRRIPPSGFASIPCRPASDGNTCVSASVRYPAGIP